MCSWRNSSCSWKILLIPLVLILGFILGLNKSSNWETTGFSAYYSNIYPWGLYGDDSAPETDGMSSLDRRWTAGLDGGDKIASSISSAPIILEEDMDVQQPVIGMEDDELTTTLINGSNNIFVSRNETQDASLTTQLVPRNVSCVNRLEGNLVQARAAIKEARNRKEINDSDYTPYGPIYFNPSLFHRSYLEMERKLKVYVYEEGEPPIFHDGPCKSIYAMEGSFIFHMETTKFRTRDPEKAHVFFLPISSSMMVRFISDRKSRDHWSSMKRTLKDYVNLIAFKYPFWNRSRGADHFIVACHDWGPELSKAVPNLFTNSIRALCNANTSEGFKPSKDVSIPEILLQDGTMHGLVGGPSPRQRRILAFFAGGVHGPIRPILLQHWENKDPDIQVHKYLPKGGVSYMDMLRQSRYCISPSGYEVASPRMVEALYTGCVPVLIKDHYVAPFSDVLNWKSFAVIIQVEDIPKLKEMLMGISTRQYLRMQRRGKQVKRHFEVNYPPKRYDVFHMILHSVWLRRLNARIHGSN